MRISVGFLLIACACSSDAPTTSAVASIDVADQWLPAEAQAPVYLVGEDGGLFSPVHATLLPDQRVMLLGLPVNGGATKGALFTPTPLGQTPPPWMVVDSQPVPLEAQNVQVDGWTVDDTPFCAGQTLLADGSLFIAGGMRVIAQGSLAHLFGVDYGMTYRDGTWTRITDRMKSRAQQGDPIRWYPSTTRLADGKVLVVGGRDYVASLWDGNFVQIGTENISADLYDPATQTFSTASAYGATPTGTFNADYSHVFQLPYDIPQDVLVFGERGDPLRWGPNNAWIETRRYRPDTALDGSGNPIEQPNNGASTAMLPIRVNNGDKGYLNGSIMVVGGTHDRPHEHAVDVYDPVYDAWHPRRDMGIRRHHPSTVLLPDGNLLILAGHDDAGANGDPLLRHAQLVDTQNGFAIANGTTAMGEPRGYHNIALLLPDGRVLVGGGRDAGPDSASNEKPSIRYYHPPYLSRPRPALGYAPTRVKYGEGFWVTHDRAVTEAVLIALGSMTHSIDMNQRAVQLAHHVANANASVLVAPPNAETAPPGHYMLFVLDANRTPSVARIIEVGP